METNNNVNKNITNNQPQTQHAISVFVDDESSVTSSSSSSLSSVFNNTNNFQFNMEKAEFLHTMGDKTSISEFIVLVMKDWIYVLSQKWNQVKKKSFNETFSNNNNNNNNVIHFRRNSQSNQTKEASSPTKLLE